MGKRKNEAIELASKKLKLDEEEKKQRRRESVKKYKNSDKGKASETPHLQKFKFCC